jgi:hypothetical protein
MEPRQSLNTGSDNANRCVCVSRKSSRRLHFATAAQTAAFGPSTCDQPLLAQCLDCLGLLLWRCKSSDIRKCESCSITYRRNLQRKAVLGFREDGFHYLLTLTAPGAQGHNLPNGEPCACTPREGVDLPHWNATLGQIWNRLRTSIKRDRPDLQYFAVNEVQRRGALHKHVLVWSPEPLLVTDIRPLAIAAGFGHEVDLDPIRNRAASSTYLSKYVTKAVATRARVPWSRERVDVGTGEIWTDTKPSFRTWSSSAGWGPKMAEIRAVHAASLRAQIAARATTGEREPTSPPAVPLRLSGVGEGLPPPPFG